MSPTHLLLEPSASHVVAGDSSESLLAVRRAGINLAVWRRGRTAGAEAAIWALLNASRALRIDLRAPDAGALGAALREIAGSRAPATSIRTLAADIAALAQLFSDVAGTVHPRVRFERVEDDGCAIFHADSLNVRLLCTYAGPGTEWLENANVRRGELGSRGRSIADTNAAIVIDPSAIRRIPAWHVAAFTGRARTGTPALIHRSAPVSSTLDFRLRLCIDLPDGCGC